VIRKLDNTIDKPDKIISVVDSKSKDKNEAIKQEYTSEVVAEGSQQLPKSNQ
jgi:hypothetical protein